MSPTNTNLPFAFVAKLVAKDDLADEVADFLAGAVGLARARWSVGDGR